MQHTETTLHLEGGGAVPRAYSNVQKKPGLRSRPYVAQISETTNPARQNAASTFNASVSMFVVAESREIAWTNVVICNLQQRKTLPTRWLLPRTTGFEPDR